MADVPVLVLACIEAAAELPADNQAGLWGSLLPAAWSYQLAARARGLGTAWTTLHLRYEREVSELLGIPPHVRHGVLLPTAYYTGETFRPGAARTPGPASCTSTAGSRPSPRTCRSAAVLRRALTRPSQRVGTLREPVPASGYGSERHSYRVVPARRYADRDPDDAAVPARHPAGRRDGSPHG